jgi:hypothetical protein
MKYCVICLKDGIKNKALDKINVEIQDGNVNIHLTQNYCKFHLLLLLQELLK